jgi:hypothetical protein
VIGVLILMLTTGVALLGRWVGSKAGITNR